MRLSLIRDTHAVPELEYAEARCGGAKNILHAQCFDWNAKPLRGGGTFREQRNMQWRVVSQHGVQFCVVSSGGTRDVERSLDRRMRLKGEAAVQRDVKDEPEIEIDRVERRQVCEPVERLLSSFFGSLDKR